MQLTDYTNPAKFPATSQKGLSALMQLRIDAHNLDELRGLPAGTALSANQQARLKELLEKEPHMARLAKEASQQEASQTKPV
jgi:hypothetical protein